MKITRVGYTVQQSFVEQNKKNIESVMQELRALNRQDIFYSSYVLDDGKTFMHFVVSKGDDASEVLGSLEAFKHFQSELKASNPEVPPKPENLTLVASSFDM